MKRVLIAGVGNILLQDDGVGPFVARTLEARYDFGPNVEVIDIGTPALDFVELLLGLDGLIVIDAVTNRTEPGTVSVYGRADILKQMPQVRVDPHSPALAESLLTADLFGDPPKEVALVGISGEWYDAGCDLSPSVMAAVDRAIDAVLAELDRLGATYTPKAQPLTPEIWWASTPQQLAV